MPFHRKWRHQRHQRHQQHQQHQQQHQHQQQDDQVTADGVLLTTAVFLTQITCACWLRIALNVCLRLLPFFFFHCWHYLTFLCSSSKAANMQSEQISEADIGKIAALQTFNGKWELTSALEQVWKRNFGSHFIFVFCWFSCSYYSSQCLRLAHDQLTKSLPNGLAAVKEGRAVWATLVTIRWFAIHFPDPVEWMLLEKKVRNDLVIWLERNFFKKICISFFFFFFFLTPNFTG